jgi:ATP-dependent 26S proteasome regulatory subunit
MTSSLDSYLNDLSLNIKANHPITIVYTDDLNETLAITKQAIPTLRKNTDKVFYWTARNRWTDITAKDKPLAELIAQPVELTLNPKQTKTPLQFVFSSPEELKCRNPVFILSLVSAQFKNENIGILQELRDFDYLARHGINDSYRVIILANNTFECPPDYENIFGVVRFNPPNRDELSKLYDEYFIKDYIVKILSPIYEGKPDQLEKDFKELKTYCVNTLSGLSSRQFKLILYKGVSFSAEKTNSSIVKRIDYEKFKEYLYQKKFEEISKSEVIELLKPITMDQVGGLDNLKDWLNERAWTFSDEAKKLNVRRSKGCALIGPPGTGKTWVAKAASSILNVPCLKFNASSIFNKYVGESEQRMEQVLKTVEAVAPCVLFIDEIDKVFANQAGGNSSGDSGTSSRVFGKLLSWMQDTKEEIFVIVTANRIQNIPSEFLRKGRLDEIWCITFPTKEERKTIINIHLKKRGYEVKNIEKLLDATVEFSSSELEYVVEEAILKAGIKKQKLTEDYLISEVKNTTPSSIAFKDDIERMKEWAHRHARMASKPEKMQLQDLAKAEI